MRSTTSRTVLNTTSHSPRSSDELHNMNCFDFFVHLFSILNNDEYSTFWLFGGSLKRSLATHQGGKEELLVGFLRSLKSDTYIKNATYPAANIRPPAYGDKYSEFMELFESVCAHNKKPESYTILLNAIYSCPQSILNRAATLTYNKSQEEVIRILQLGGFEINKHGRINKISPCNRGSFRARAVETVSSESHPMNSTSICCMRRYAYQAAMTPPYEIRMGTQAIIGKGSARINPIFKRWIQIAKNGVQDLGQPLNDRHIYFNLLSAHPHSYYTPKLHKPFEKNKETVRSEALHAAANDLNGKLIVIDLPSENSIFNHRLALNNIKNTTVLTAYHQMLSIATNPIVGRKNDFRISDWTKQEIANIANESYLDICKRLLTKSFHQAGMTSINNETVIECQIQAAYFHFLKYEIPNLILQTLKPLTFNMTCKDGIDRGGVASAYYNLMKSLTTDKPMTAFEFHEAVHAAPINVKGRLMNENIHALWNAIGFYLKNHQKQRNYPTWLDEWYHANQPYEVEIKQVNHVPQKESKHINEEYNPEVGDEQTYSYEHEYRSKDQSFSDLGREFRSFSISLSS